MTAQLSSTFSFTILLIVVFLCCSIIRYNTNNYVGGGSYGLMGAIAQTIHEGGGKVIGVIPAALKKIERPGKLSYTTPPTPSRFVTIVIPWTMCPPSFNGHAGSFHRKTPVVSYSAFISSA